MPLYTGRHAKLHSKRTSPFLSPVHRARVIEWPVGARPVLDCGDTGQQQSGAGCLVLEPQL